MAFIGTGCQQRVTTNDYSDDVSGAYPVNASVHAKLRVHASWFRSLMRRTVDALTCVPFSNGKNS